MNSDHISFTLLVLLVGLIFVIFKITIRKFDNKIKGLHRVQEDNVIKLAEEIAGLIIMNRLFTGKRGSVSLSVCSDVLLVCIGHQELFEIPMNYDKYLP